MIHHISIPARDPEHVAKVLAELLGGYAGPFIGPIPGAWVAYAEDAHGTGLEVYPERTTLVPGEGGDMGAVALRDAPVAVAFHALISVKVGRGDIERIGAREGWRTQHFWRGPNPQVRLFELYEFWVENRIMLELVTEDMVEAYRKLAQGPAQRDLLARLAAARP
ncbi:hypothetical protein [Geothrix campi]|uniref:hypothetical protein n=1 Tax=Geothrix campi TaxID=2966450 RepID=UPI0021485604|nr:hypothetical protein [Geothrix sp. SG10]